MRTIWSMKGKSRSGLPYGLSEVALAARIVFHPHLREDHENARIFEGIPVKDLADWKEWDKCRPLGRRLRSERAAIAAAEAKRLRKAGR